MQKQPRFAVTTFVLVVLCALAILSKILSPYVVQPANKRLASAGSTYLQAALHQHVAWYPLSERAFQDARRLDRPILLVIGSPWSLTGRQMDGQVFNSMVVQKLLAREFVCIRADSVETPDWVASYLPLSRAGLGLSPDMQLWMLDSQARLFRPVAPHAEDAIPSEYQFTAELAMDLTDLQAARDAEFNFETSIKFPGMLQTDDFTHLFASPQNLSPNLVSYELNLAELTQANSAGGFPVRGRQRLRPGAWRFLLATVGAQSASTSVEGLLHSPCTDLLDGGFFYGSSDPFWRTPAFDKVAVLNAEMCDLLARLAVEKPDGPYRHFAISTFDSLAGEFLDSEGLIRPCRMGDEEGHFGRSARSSFSPRQVRAALTGLDRSWAYNNLNLRPTANAVVTPFLSDFSVLEKADFSRIMGDLKKSIPAPLFDNEVTLASFGPSAARLLSAARIMQDPEKLRQASEIVNRIELFRQGVDVVHELTPSERAKPVLTDYLGYADAALEDFLTFGRAASIQTGASVLEQGLKRFAVPGQSCFRMASNESLHGLAPDSNSPQLTDDTGEAANAKAIRLAWSYSVLLSNSASHADRELSVALRVQATGCVTQFADVATGMGPYTGGYANAAALVSDDTFVLCAGPNPDQMVGALSSISPLRMIAPAVGPVFPTLFKRPGYYISRRGQLVGPLNLSGAVAALPKTLFLNG